MSLSEHSRVSQQLVYYQFLSSSLSFRDTVLRKPPPTSSAAAAKTPDKLLVLVHWPERKVFKCPVKPALLQVLYHKVRRGHSVSFWKFFYSSFLKQIIWFTNYKLKLLLRNWQVCSPVYEAKRIYCPYLRKECVPLITDRRVVGGRRHSTSQWWSHLFLKLGNCIETV